jgi:ketosteroid isomerase-like protein
MKAVQLLLCIVCYAAIPAVYASDDPHVQDRAAMRALLSDIETAMNSKNFDIAMKHLDQNVVITYLTAEVTVGPEQARDYYNKMIGGSNALIKGFRTKGEVSAPATFYGNTAVAYGTTEETYSFADGVDFDFKGHWTATLHKNNGDWKIVALHFSTSITDNPLLNDAAQYTRIVGIVTFVIGIALSLVVMWLVRRRRRQ